jgi:hypothetical protein
MLVVVAADNVTAALQAVPEARLVGELIVAEGVQLQ